MVGSWMLTALLSTAALISSFSSMQVEDPPCVANGCKPRFTVTDQTVYAYVDLQIIPHFTSSGKCSCTADECALNDNGCNNNSTVVTIIAGGIDHGTEWEWNPQPVSGCGSGFSTLVQVSGGPVNVVFTASNECSNCKFGC